MPYSASTFLFADTLPLSEPPPAAAMAAPSLGEEAVARFDALLHELNPGAVHVDAPRLRALCAWLATLPPQAARAVIDDRLRQGDHLRALLADADWDAGAALRERLARLVAYLDQDDDLIPDGEPLLGRLDDALLLELAWPAFATEAAEYGDFAAYRAETGFIEAGPAADAATRRAAWLRDRLAEIALWRHHQRVNDSHYSDRGRAEAPFRIGG